MAELEFYPWSVSDSRAHSFYVVPHCVFIVFLLLKPEWVIESLGYLVLWIEFSWDIA